MADTLHKHFGYPAEAHQHMLLQGVSDSWGHVQHVAERVCSHDTGA